MWDNSHHASLRGYGVIIEEGDPAQDGPPRWKVEWEHGQRRSTVSELYLLLPLMQHTNIKAPTALGQDILVVVGTHKGKTGKTVSKVTMPAT